MCHSSDQAASRDVNLASAGLLRQLRANARPPMLASALPPLANSGARPSAWTQRARITAKRPGTYEPIETCDSVPLGQL